MPSMIRMVATLAAAAVIWFSEDAVFSYGLGFNPTQTVILTAYFVALFGVAIWIAARTIRRRSVSDPDVGGIPMSRLIGMVPALTLMVGSFAALPVVILVLVLGTAI